MGRYKEMHIPGYSPEKLKALLKKHGITRERAAQLVFATKNQMDDWCLPAQSAHWREMPLAHWELLLIKLGEVTPEVIGEKSK